MLRKLRRILLWTVAGLVVLLGVAYLLRGPLFGGLVARRIAAELSLKLGGRFTIAKVEGGWLSDIALVGLRMREAPPDGPLVRFECGRAAVEYDLFGLLGDRPLDAVASLDVSNASVELDLTRPAGPAADEAKEPFTLDFLPESLPVTAVTASLAVRTRRGDVRAGRITLSGARDRLELDVKDLEAPDFPATKRYRAAIERLDRERWRMTSTDEIGGVLLERATAKNLPGGWQLGVDAQVGGGRIKALADARIATGQFENVDLARLPGFRSPVAGVVSGMFLTEWELLVLEVAARDLELEGFRADALDARVHVLAKSALVERLDARADEATVAARGLSLVFAHPYVVTGVREVTVDVPDLRAYLPDLDYPVAVQVQAQSTDEKTITLEQVRVEAQGSSVQLQGAAHLPDDPAQWKETRLDLQLAGTLTDAARLHGELPRIEGSITVAGSVAGSLAEPVATLDVEGRALKVEERAVEHLLLAGELAWPELRIRDLNVRAEPGTIVLKGAADLEKKTLRDGSFVAEIQDLAGFAAMIPGAPSVAGSLEGSGSIAWDGERARGEARLTAERLVWGGGEIGTVFGRATVDGGTITVEELQGAGPWGNARARGEVDLDRRTARAVELVGSYDGRSGELLGPLDVAWRGDEIALRNLDLAVLRGRVTGGVTWKGVLEGALVGERIDLAALDKELAGRARLQLTGEGGSFTIDVDAPQLTYEGNAGRVVVRAVQDETGLKLERISIRVGTALEVEGTGRLPLRLLPGTGFVRVEKGGVEPELDLTALVRDVERFVGLRAASASVSVRGDAAGLRATARLKDVAVHEDLLLRGDTWIEATAGSGGLFTSIVAERNEFGELRGVVRSKRGIDWTRPEDLRAAVEEARIEGDLAFEVPDLAVARKMLPGLVRLGGQGSVRLAVSGTLRDLRATGKASVSNVSCKLPGRIPTLQDGSAEVFLEARRTLRIEGLQAQLGYAPVGLAGTITLPEGDDPGAIDVTLVGENALLVRDRDLRLRADLDLALKGSLDAPQVTGKIRLRDALYSRPHNLFASTASADRSLQLFSFREGILSRATFDVEVTSEQGFRVSNNVVRGAFSLDLVLRGTGAVPLPQGSVFFRETLVKLPLSSLKVDQGELRFSPDNPFAPRLNVAGHTRMQGYDIDVQVVGRMPEFDVYVSTRPPLPQEDALLLLTTGRTAAEHERAGWQGAALAVGGYFGKRAVANVSGPSDPDRRTLLDRFSFTVGREVSRSGAETIEGEFEISRRVYLRGEQDRFDDQNFGVVWRLRFR